MKKILLVVLTAICSPKYSHGQYVIYICEKTGVFGAGFNNDNMPTTYKECADFAKRKCEEAGGTECRQVAKSRKQGWCALITATQGDILMVQSVEGHDSKAGAEAAVREKFRAKGGLNSDDIAVYSWYAYSNLKE